MPSERFPGHVNVGVGGGICCYAGSAIYFNEESKRMRRFKVSNLFNEKIH